VPTRNFRIKVAYRGDGLHGWQRQENGLSVQELLEEAVGRVLGHPVVIHGSGRTDAGVHAAGQVASFFTTSSRNPVQIVRGSNRFLPGDVAVLEAEEVPPDFHARFSCTGKTYSYDFLISPTRNPLLDWRSWWVGARMDWARVAACLALLVGEKDFAAFRGTGSDSKGTIREIYGARLLFPGQSIARVEISGSGFLRHMMRSIAGTLWEVGRGRVDVDGFKGILDSGERFQAGQTAPPGGLCLVEAYYSPKEGLRTVAREKDLEAKELARKVLETK
jgi:tRNA pseudouridine38-40 synthase